MSNERYIPARASAHGPFSAVVTPERAGWGYSSLRVLELPPGESIEFDTAGDEMLVLPLSGACAVECDDRRIELTGRGSLFTEVSDFAYLPRAAKVRVATVGGGRFALPGARAERRFPFRYGPAANVPVELRGAGAASREVHNFCSPEVFEADRLIAVEVLTPGGNWSSYPPHKHDQHRAGLEEALEEIYYFEVAPGMAGAGFAYQRVYASDPQHPIDVCTEVRSGDIVLIPFGYHGPSMAAPDYDLYYLNVMAGPGERVWRFCDDPAHAWIRSSWAGAEIDPRLPMTSAISTSGQAT
ncbi:MAG: 5-deoxy-glucuronate isomerase [Candidatus Velthaea sp.]